MRVALWLVLATLVGCSNGATTCRFNSDCPTGRYCASGACRADCASDAECVAMLGAGAACSSFGMCVSGPDGGLPLDAGPTTPDAGRDAYVADDAGSDGGGIVDGGIDSSTDDAAVCVAEVCTPSTGAAPSADEDCDGAIDEGCPWYFGRPHAVLPMMWALGSGRFGCFGSYLDENGTELYTACSGTSAALMHAHRGDRASPFDPPTAVAFADSSLVVYEVTLERGGLRGVAQAGSPVALYLISRATLSTPFTATPIASGVGGAHPTLSRDGLELFFVVGPDILRATRPTPADDFGTATPVTGLQGGGLSLSEDGHDLFFHAAPSGRPNTLFRAHRADVTTATFDAPVELTDLNPTGADDIAHPSVSIDTRELFFAAANRAWQPTSNRALYRVQICRDGPCDEPLIDCPASGRRSPDGFHCYRSPTAGTAPATWMQGVLDCAADGAHLATVHSEAERALLASVFGVTWLGGTDATTEMTWRWDWPGRVTPEEPFLYAPGMGLWGPGEPNDYGAAEDCLLDNGAGNLFNDGMCTGPFTPVCEDETWPTW